MMRLRFLCSALVISLLLSGGTVRADDPSAEDMLSKAVSLFDAKDYEAARDTLRDIEQDELSEEMQLRAQQLLSMCRTALVRIQEAADDLEAGLAAKKAGDADKARRLLERVVANKEASDDQKGKASAALKEIGEPAAPQPKPVASPLAQSVGDSSLLHQMSEEYDLLWQQAVATYRDTESKIRTAVLKEDFAEARRLMDFAKQTIELNRRYATPASLYETYMMQANELAGYVEEEETAYQELAAKRARDEILARGEAERSRIQSVKDQQVDGLLDQAAQLSKERRYEDAIEVLGQILLIDPENEEAEWKRDTLEDLAMQIRDQEHVKTRGREIQSLLIENEEAMIPWHDHLIYPKNWREISAKRRGAEEESESETNRVVRQRLKKAAPELRFDAVEFEQVIEQLRAMTGLNFVVNWSALEFAGVEKDREVSMILKDVPFEKALQLVLDDVGGGEVQLAYEIDDGVIQVSSKDDLSRKTVTRVYNVQDLLISVPTFRGRQINLDQVGQNSQEGGLGGGRYIGGAGGGGGQSNNIFGGGGQQNDDELRGGTDEDPLQPIIELIQQTIDPDSWRDSGGSVGSIQSLNQQIIVTQTSTAHGELRDLLRQLRKARALQVAVEARYITVSRNWVEQIGVDLDIVLNNGNAGFDRTTIIDPATGNAVLVPRQFSRNGFTPGAPGGVGIALPTQPFGQPYGQPGLVPATGNVGYASGSMTPIPIVNNTLDLGSPSDTNVSGSLGSLVNQSPAFQIFGSFLDNIQVDFLLRASQVDRRASDLDSPRLVLFNGQRAAFESFVEQDYIAALTPVIGDNAGAFEPNIDTALTGRSLDVQATVSADRRYVTMTVRTFTRVTGDFRTVFFGGSQTVGSGFVELATQTTQQVRTTVSVPDGGTLLIGGLKLSGERDVDAGVPILSRIPILKRAFSNTSNVKDDQILLILIKPTIIIQEEAEADAFPTLSAVTSD